MHLNFFFVIKNHQLNIHFDFRKKQDFLLINRCKRNNIFLIKLKLQLKMPKKHTLTQYTNMYR